MKTKLLVLIFILFTDTSSFAQKYEYRIVTTVESLIPSGIGISRMIISNETRDYKTLTISRSEEESSRNSSQRSDIRVKAFDESELLNFYNLGGIRFQNIVANDAVVTSKLNAMADEGWDLTFVNSGVESDAGRADDNAIFITRYVFRREKKAIHNESSVSDNSSKDHLLQSFTNNNNKPTPKSDTDYNQELKNIKPDSSDNKINLDVLVSPDYTESTKVNEKSELENIKVNLFQNPLKSTIKRNGSIFNELNFQKEITKINSGTPVEVLGYRKWVLES